MALGGGIWNSQNKLLPGAYINFSSAANASPARSERGLAAMPLMLDWGPEDSVITITNKDFSKNSFKLFGYVSSAPEMLPLRELFHYASTLYAYRLNGGGTKAENTYCSAKYSGTFGNKLQTVISKNVDNEELFDVATYYQTNMLDMQTVSAATELVNNDFVIFKSEASLAETDSTPLTGGTNGSAQTAAYQNFLDKIESYSFNTLGCPTDDQATISLFVNFTKRMRDEVGAKFQTVVYSRFGTDKLADYEGIIEIGNEITGFDPELAGFGAFGLVYWVTGASAGCAANKSNTNLRYDGELTVNVDFTQTELEQGISEGRFMFHNVNGEIRVLEDINSLVTLSDSKQDSFKSNQTVRVCDQIANDAAIIFNTKYLGVVPNDAAGRVSLWNDICKLLSELESIRAIEAFDPDTVTVEAGSEKKSVLLNISGLNIVNAMAQLYMSVIIA